jgi:hypothetical protein
MADYPEDSVSGENMQALLSSVSDPSDLSHISAASTPYHFDRIFHAKGFGAKRLEKQRLKLMKAIDGQVQRMLGEGEKVEFVSWGIEYSFAEHYFMGLWAQLINRRALICTSHRLLIIQINSKRKVMELKSQVRYQAIEKFARGTFGYLTLVLRDGKKLVLTGIPRKDRKPIKDLITGKLEAARADAPGSGRENLCPHCGHRVMGYPDRCNRCAGAFKSGSKAGWLSLAFPGLGDFYLGHRVLGVVEMLGAAAAWGIVVVPTAIAATVEPGSYVELAVLGSVIFVFVHGVDSWITRRVGFKGIYPAAE